jgi:polysaccharide export outer membrane protein
VRRGALVLGGACVCLVTGCENDSYLNPAVTGRWENTPTIVPILDRLSVVEGTGPGEMGEFAKVTSEDLIPEVDVYRVDAGDTVEVIVNELFNPGSAERFERTVDPRGFIDLPQLSSVFIAGMSSEESAQSIARQYKSRRVLNEPVVSVNILARRRLTYNVMGGVTAPGTYAIPRPEFRLLEALTQAGSFQEQTQFVYVIRSVALSDKAAGRFRPGDAAGAPDADIMQPPQPGKTVTVPEPGKGDSVIDLIDALGAPPSQGQPGPSPSVLDPNGQRSAVPVIDIDTVARTGAPSASGSGGVSTARVAPAATRGSTLTSAGGSRWVFVNGQWVSASSVAGLGGQRGVNVNAAQNILTQRVLRVPLASLLSGSAQHNVIVRPGDIIRLPSQPEGLVYMDGQVQRPGPISLPTVGGMTLKRAIVAAGGLGDTAIPERVDITRFVGPDRQATVRLNYRAIQEGTQPDLYLRDGDIINVGTNFWALPLAVVRNGFRASYGFGFILDRNFGFDVFGPQRTNDTSF